MSDRIFGRQKAHTSTFSNPSLVSPTTPTLANPTRGFGITNSSPIQTATEVAPDLQQAQSADEQLLEPQAIKEKPLSHDISRISLRRPQAKLTVGQPTDQYEQEADMMANRVRSMPAPTVQRQIATEEQTQENVVDVNNPVVIPKDPKTAPRLQQLSDEAMRRLPGVGRTFLNEWFSAVSSGVNSIPEPSDPDANKYWWIALAGNLAWAATSLMGPEMTILVSTISFGGAAVGSGIMQHSKKSTTPAGKPYLVTQLAKVRDKMQNTLRPIIVDTAIECVRGNITDQKQQDQLLWTKLFPGVSQTHEFETLVSDAITQAGAALDDFTRQYQEWRERIEAEAERRAPIEIKENSREKLIEKYGEKYKAFSPSDFVSQGFMVLSLIQDLIPICEGEMPFQPNLKF